jgi:hypothetical protein
MDLATALNDLTISQESIPEEPSMSSFLKQIFARGAENLDAIGASAPISMLEPMSALEQISRINGAKFASIGGESELARLQSVLSFFVDSALVIPSHGGRKPINPIISEVFTCSYVPSGGWCADAPVHVLIEQVEHHPPINCMRVYSNKSGAALESTQHFDFKLGKGLYFVLDNKGYAKLYLEKFKEDYNVHFPNFIILPKMSMNGTADIMITGKMVIKSSSGLVAQIKFEEKVLKNILFLVVFKISWVFGFRIYSKAGS